MKRRAGVMKHTIARILMAGSVSGGVLFAGSAAAIDWNVTGFVRQEIAYSISDTGNYNNQMTSPFADRITPHMTHASTNPANAAAPTTIFTNRDGIVGGVFNAGAASIAAGANTSSPVDCRFALENALAAGTPGLIGG